MILLCLLAVVETRLGFCDAGECCEEQGRLVFVRLLSLLCSGRKCIAVYVYMYNMTVACARYFNLVLGILCVYESDLMLAASFLTARS